MKNQQLIRIVFAGSPGTGKTSVLEVLKSRVNPSEETRVHVGFVDEAATELLRNIHAEAECHPLNNPVLFQRLVIDCQHAMEQAAIDRNFPCNILICDRGLADAFAYVGEQDAQDLLGKSIDESLNEYDAVLFFKPFQSEKVREGNEYRYENGERMTKLAEKTFEVWGKHPNFYKVPAFSSINQKAEYVSALLNYIVETKLFA